jgi:hypothetical protein
MIATEGITGMVSKTEGIVIPPKGGKATLPPDLGRGTENTAMETGDTATREELGTKIKIPTANVQEFPKMGFQQVLPTPISHTTLPLLPCHSLLLISRNNPLTPLNRFTTLTFIQSSQMRSVRIFTSKAFVIVESTVTSSTRLLEHPHPSTIQVEVRIRMALVKKSTFLPISLPLLAGVCLMRMQGKHFQ